MVELEQMREKYLLQDRIELLGSVRPSNVRSVLTRGQIYLNTSLTEAFGISIIEAASAGLFVVSTRVGGVPEILPGDMIEFARAEEEGEWSSPSSSSHQPVDFPYLQWTPMVDKELIRFPDVIRALTHAIHTIRAGQHDPHRSHERVKGMYAWSEVAERTEAVYDRACAIAAKDLGERLSRYVLASNILWRR
jgi:phosphatidylinositol glycan class A protein